jgi:hypothetical protein
MLDLETAMTYRGVVSKGKIVLEADVRLPEGTVVTILPVEKAASSLPDLPAFGIWRDRTELQDPGEASLELRRRMERRDHKGDDGRR